MIAVWPDFDKFPASFKWENVIVYGIIKVIVW